VTHEVNSKGQRYEITAKFRDFSSISEAFDEHAKLLATNPRYVHVVLAKTPEEAAHALTGVYATDPNYGTNIARIIDEDNLKQYDV